MTDINSLRDDIARQFVAGPVNDALTAIQDVHVRLRNIINFRSQNNLQDNADVIRAVQVLRAEIERSIVDRDAVQLGIPRRSDERIYAMWLLRTFQALTELQE